MTAQHKNRFTYQIQTTTSKSFKHTRSIPVMKIEADKIKIS